MTCFYGLRPVGPLVNRLLCCGRSLKVSHSVGLFSSWWECVRVCACLTVRLHLHERTSSPVYLHFFFCGRRCRDWRVLFRVIGLKHQIHTPPCSGRMSDRVPTFLRTCFCAMTRVDFCRNPWSTSPGNNNTAKCVTSQFALPLRASGTMRRINKSKAPRESAQQTLMPLQIPGSTQEISPSAPAPRQTNPSGERAEEDHVEEMQLQQQQSTQQKENAASVSTLRLELRCILVAASEQSLKRFPACKHFHRTILESGGLLLHRTVVFIYLRIKAWLPSRSPCAAAPPSSWDQRLTCCIRLSRLLLVLFCWRCVLFHAKVNLDRNRVQCFWVLCMQQHYIRKDT